MAVYSNYPWSQGDNAQGFHIVGNSGPGGGAIVPGVLQKQYGVRSFTPAITQPGTVASAGTVQNTTGFDCNVYLYSQSGISSVKVETYSGSNLTTWALPGSIPAGQMFGPVEVPGPGALVVTYPAGSLNWLWMPA